MKFAWFISGFIFLAGFIIIAPLMKILHWPGADPVFLISAFFGLIFIPLCLLYFYKKIK
jgi:hypothetical protein